ncbi:MAG: ribonuclease H [Thalassospira sp. Nap_22]|nr:MAG: ribonuclease H [Thalassospira sp. Nap_22]
MTNQPQQPITIYTDGACIGNPGPGGWAALIEQGKRKKTFKGGEADTTNNRMELMAAIKALEALRRPLSVTVITDSQYVRNGITEWIDKWKKNGWRTSGRKPVKNADLWKCLDGLCETHRVEWQWVKGHSGNEGNERVDGLAQQEALKYAKAA